MVALMGCGATTEPAAEPAPVPIAVPAPARVVVPQSQVVVGDPSAVGVELQFEGVGPLFQGFFAQPELVAQLGKDLGTCVRGGLAVVVITWSDETRIGTVALRLDPEMVGCAPTATADGLDLTPMVPMGQALAKYRDAVSGRYDLRLASFHVGIKVLRGMNHCAFWSGGQYPPDGTLWKRCVDLAGVPACMPGDRHDGVSALRLEPDDAAYAKACFGL